MPLCPQADIYMTERAQKGPGALFRHVRMAHKDGQDGRQAEDRQEDHPFSGNAHAPLAGLDGLLRPGRKLASSQDASGSIASSARFDDDYTACESIAEKDDAVLDYYANILMPFGPLIEKKIAEVQGLGLEIEVIAPDHGVIWETRPRPDIADVPGHGAGQDCAQRCDRIRHDVAQHQQMTQFIARASWRPAWSAGSSS